MFNRKLEPGLTNPQALFSPEAERSWAGRTVPPATPAAVTPDVTPGGQEQPLPPVERTSYRILRDGLSRCPGSG